MSHVNPPPQSQNDRRGPGGNEPTQPYAQPPYYGQSSYNPLVQPYNPLAVTTPTATFLLAPVSDRVIAAIIDGFVLAFAYLIAQVTYFGWIASLVIGAAYAIGLI